MGDVDGRFHFVSVLPTRSRGSLETDATLFLELLVGKKNGMHGLRLLGELARGSFFPANRSAESLQYVILSHSSSLY